MYLPTPYPDEWIGSMISRASVHTGLSIAEVMTHFGGLQSEHASFFLPKTIARLAESFHTSPEQVLLDHTVFPFGTAFMPKAARMAFQEAFLTAVSVRSTAALVQSLAQNARRHVFCPECLYADINNYGETYWHRMHFLPGIAQCPLHRVTLLSIPSVRRFGLSLRAGPRPLDISNASPVQSISDAVDFTETFSKLAVATLGVQWRNHDDWAAVYRHMALSKGYVMRDGTVAGSQLAMNLLQTISPETLQTIGCAYPSKITASWPAMLVRPFVSGKPIHAPLRHLLLLAFLQTSLPHEGPMQYTPAGPKRADYAALDKEFVRYISIRWKKARVQRIRVTVDDLTDGMPQATTFRHKRNEFPETVALIEEFKLSNQSERQTGRRPYWRRRLGLHKHDES